MPAEGGATFPFAKSNVIGVIVIALCHFMPAECGATTPPKVSLPGVVLGLVLGNLAAALSFGRKMIVMGKTMTRKRAAMVTKLGRAVIGRKNISITCTVLVLVSWLAGGGLVVLLVVV